MMGLVHVLILFTKEKSSASLEIGSVHPITPHMPPTHPDHDAERAFTMSKVFLIIINATMF